MVTRLADILEIERQNELFHNGDRPTTLTNIEGERKVREMMGGSPHLVRSLVQMDNPDHHAYRRLTQAWFMPQNLRALEPRIREIARSFIDRMAELGGRCDFARDVAFLYPLHVIMEVLGVPQVDEPRMLKLTQELFGAADPDVNRTGEVAASIEDGIAAIQATVMDFMTYFNAMTEDRRRHPRKDLASVIANGEIEGKPLGHFEAMSYYIIAATAGHDTTSNTTAGALWALAERPDEFRKLKADLSLIPSHVEESIRWVTPVKHFMRSATADAEVAGRKIAKGDWLLLCYPSGNRDEEVFADPFRYDIARSPQARGLRLWRSRLPRPAPGPDGDAHPLGRAAAAPGERRARRRARQHRRQLRLRSQDRADPLSHALDLDAAPSWPTPAAPWSPLRRRVGASGFRPPAWPWPPRPPDGRRRRGWRCRSRRPAARPGARGARGAR